MKGADEGEEIKRKVTAKSKGSKILVSPNFAVHE